MTKKGKRSVRSQRPSMENDSLNDNVDNLVVEDKRTEEVEISDMNNNNLPEQPVVNREENPETSETVNEEVVVQEEEHDTDLAMDIPEYDIKPAVSDPEFSTPPPIQYRKNLPTGTIPLPPIKTDSASMFSLSNPLMKYGLMILAAMIVLGVFFLGKKPKTSGPVIVDVTETEGGEKKSVRNSVNRVSSPRIVFGDLRKNPSLMVAPPMTPASH
jgi:hypothetical protein